MLKKFLLSGLISGILLIPVTTAFAQENTEEHTVRAKVIKILKQEEEIIPNTSVKGYYQELEAEILDEERKGEIIEVKNDFTPFEVGDVFFANYLEGFEGEGVYSAWEPDRRKAVLFFVGLLIAAILVFGGVQGLRALLGLAGSFFIIIYFLLPNLVGGAPPVLTSIIFASFILIFSFYTTHGVKKTTNAALLSTILVIIVTGVLASLAVDICNLSGFISDEAVFLNLHTGGILDFRGLLLGAIIIGMLGALDDIAITQVATVRELHHTDKNLTRAEIYKKSLAIGREHVGALVNTLALAYAGAALPLLLLIYSSDMSGLMVINKDAFATEIIRTVAGSIGVVLTVPISTWIGVVMMIESKR